MDWLNDNTLSVAVRVLSSDLLANPKWADVDLDAFLIAGGDELEERGTEKSAAILNGRTRGVRKSRWTVSDISFLSDLGFCFVAATSIEDDARAVVASEIPVILTVTSRAEPASGHAPGGSDRFASTPKLAMARLAAHLGIAAVLLSNPEIREFPLSLGTAAAIAGLVQSLDDDVPLVVEFPDGMEHGDISLAERPKIAAVIVDAPPISRAVELWRELLRSR